MKQLSKKKMNEFVARAGSKTAAALLILEELGCSLSKAEKLAGNRYSRSICQAETEKLLSLLDRDITPGQYSRQRVGEAG
jgi:hypothetical protein